MLSPLEKITVIKTFILPQFIHLLTILTSPSRDFLKILNSMFFGFIWNNKHDKIKHMYITQDYMDTGLKMVNLEKFIDSLKLTWVNKLLKS